MILTPLFSWTIGRLFIPMPVDVGGRRHPQLQRHLLLIVTP